MSAKYTISTEAQVLLKLLRIALGTEPLKEDGTPVEPFPEGVDWAEVKRLACEQNVSALAADGLNASGFIIPDTTISDSWIDEVLNIEINYNYYLQVLATLCQIFVSNGLKPIILKGYGLSLNYPVPSHRGVGDIDVFVVDENNQPAVERALNIIENQLKIKAHKVPHDYEFSFKDITVELHYDATNAYFDTPQEKYITSRLTEMLPQGIIPCPGIAGAYLPSVDFNTLYLIRHCFGHFYTASGNLRQYVDWVVFLRSHYGEIDWNALESELGRTMMRPFFDGLCTMSGRWLGMEAEWCRIAQPDDRTEQFILQDMKRSVNNGRHLYQRIRYHYGNRRKLRFISGKSWLHLLSGSIMTSVKHILNLGKSLY